MSTSIDLGRPVSGDVIDLILDDLRRVEPLLRDLRDSAADRDAVRRALAARHDAHAEAEEKHIYPTLKRMDAVSEREAEQGQAKIRASDDVIVNGEGILRRVGPRRRG